MTLSNTQYNTLTPTSRFFLETVRLGRAAIAAWLAGVMGLDRRLRSATASGRSALKIAQFYIDNAARICPGMVLTRFGETINLMIEAYVDATNGARIRLDGLRLQALELEVLQMRLVLVVSAS